MLKHSTRSAGVEAMKAHVCLLVCSVTRLSTTLKVNLTMSQGYRTNRTHLTSFLMAYTTHTHTDMPTYNYTNWESNFKDKRISKHLTNIQHLSGFMILQCAQYWNSHMYVQIYIHSYIYFMFTHMHHPPTHPPSTDTPLHAPPTPPNSFFFTAVLGLH